jgi:WD40 repeat protein
MNRHLWLAGCLWLCGVTSAWGQAAAEAALPPAAIARLGSSAYKYPMTPRLLGVAPDGRRIFTTPWSNRVDVWDAETGQVNQRHALADEKELILALSPDARLVATREAAAGLRVWELGRPAPLHRFPDYDRDFAPVTVVFGPRNLVLAVADYYGGLRLYDLATGKRLASPLADGKYDGTPLASVWITGLHFTPDGKRLFVSKPKQGRWSGTWSGSAS